jgi:hypothetical protein
MTVYAKFKTDAVIFNSVAPASITDPCTMFADSSQNGNIVSRDSSGNAISTSTLYYKLMQNSGGVSIQIGDPVSKYLDGSIRLADADGVNGQHPIGYSLEVIPPTSIGLIHLLGANAPGVISGLGFSPGEEIYLSATEGYTNNPASLDPMLGSIIKLGIADCAAGAANPTATDLILIPEVISRPGGS